VARTEEAPSWKGAGTSEEMQKAWVACYHSSMVLLKSILAGLVFLVGAAIVFFTAVLAPEPGTAISFDPVSIAKSSPLIWMLAVLVFFLGFSWEYRRVKARQAA